MALFGTLSTGASGLGVSSDNLGVIGDNIANINTTGFKSSRATFADMLPEYVGGLGSTGAMGRGANLMGIDTMFGQGSLQSTGSALDMAVTGRGFFEVKRGGETYYTRDGSFHLDQGGDLVNGAGLNVQGYQVVDDVLTSSLGDLHFDLNPVAQRETTSVQLTAMLSAEADFATTPLAGFIGTGTLDGTAAGETIANLTNQADFSTSVTAYDSLGVAHDVVYVFERTADLGWSWSAMVDGAEADLGGGALGDSGSALEISSGTLTFNTDGTLASFTQTPAATPWNFVGADTFDVDLQLGLDTAGLPVDGEIRMADSESSVTAVSQDGYTVGNLLEVQVNSDGVVTGQYSNGQEKILGQVALALFPAESGLQRLGGNLFRKTLQSGDAAMGAAGVGGRGAVAGYALERSNVELEDEFVSMIQAQRTYQANAGVVRSADEALQVLVNLV
ncbi:MAG: flagellar hook protein FlgE [Deltaproteobacteria bacterium]|nr:flagellar hook protein FlgE [Deltaproteobacteria bacterium]